MERRNGSAEATRLDWPLPEVARLTLTCGPELNTLTFEMIEGLHKALDTARAERARVVIVTGDGRAFCSGAHVTYFTDSASGLAGDPARIRDIYVKSIVAAFRKLQDGPFATIAAINGFALGGGCELALSCEFRLMAAGARIGLTEARLGAVPGAGGLQLLAKIVGRARALEVILLADQWSAEQALSADVGLFARASSADGRTETYAFTEIDRSLSGGVLIKGGAWDRGQDTVGIALARNGLSGVHRDYLAAGGLGFFVGDGRLSYRPETILEAFYSLGIAKGAGLSLDWQQIRNPAYNADRGPVGVASIRLHSEF